VSTSDVLAVAVLITGLGIALASMLAIVVLMKLD
jgi:hypothetical protein